MALGKRELFMLALKQAHDMSLTRAKGEKVFVMYSKEITEFTIVPESSLKGVMEIEPDLIEMATVFNGELINSIKTDPDKE